MKTQHATSSSTAVGIYTAHGNFINFAMPSVGSIDLSDITLALSRIPRWAGHTQSDKPFSVLAHLLLCDWLYFWVRDNAAKPKGCDPQYWRIGVLLLMHDFHEAYIGDIPGPLEQYLPELRGIKRRLDTAIHTAFGVCPVPSYSCDCVNCWRAFRWIKTIDRLARRVENWYLRDGEPIPLAVKRMQLVTVHDVLDRLSKAAPKELALSFKARFGWMLSQHRFTWENAKTQFTDKCHA